MGGCDPQLETHVHGAFNAGLTEAEIVEAVMTLIPYIGFPRALNAMAVVKRVVEKRRRLVYCRASSIFAFAS